MPKPLPYRLSKAIDQSFVASLIKLLSEAALNDHDDNDAVYMGVPHGKLSDQAPVRGGGVVNMPDLAVLGHFAPVLAPLEAFYTALDDDASRDLLLRLVAYRLLGSRAVKLPLCTPEYQAIEDHWCASGRETDLRAAIDLGDGRYCLSCHDSTSFCIFEQLAAHGDPRVRFPLLAGPASEAYLSCDGFHPGFR